MTNARLGDTDRFNLMLSLTAFLVDGAEHSVEDLAKHFNTSEKEIVEAVRLIGFTELIDIYDRRPYVVDFDDLHDGWVAIRFSRSVDLTDVPRLSSRQASALAAGLAYLASLPGLTEVGEIEQLQKILAASVAADHSKPEIDIVPGVQDADLAIIREALARGLSISCDYLNLRGETSIDRILEPIQLEPQADLVYLRAWCPTNQEVRAFRLDRMRKAQVLSDRPISEAAKKAEFPEEIYTPGANDIEVVLEVEPEAYSLMHDFRPVETPISVSEHVKRFKVKVGDVRVLGRLISRFGGAARVISPEQARVAVKTFALESMGINTQQAPKELE